MERIADAGAFVPQVRPGVAATPLPYGTELRRRRFGPLRGLVGRVFGVSPYRTLRLDLVSAAAWRLMDGTRTVRDVQAALAKEFPREEDLTPRLGRLVGRLVSEGFLELR